MRRIFMIGIALCFAASAHAAQDPTSNRFDPRVKGQGDGASAPRTGGDTIETATVIPSLPYLDSGATCGYAQDYSDCVYNAGAPDVVYSYTPSSNGVTCVSLCGSVYDTALWIYAGGVGNTVGCNDDFCGLQSEIDHFAYTAGVTYYIVVSGYGTACGSYTLDVHPCSDPCQITCPAGAQQEGEPACYDGYIDNYNGGCNSTGWTVVNGDANGNADVCGLSGTYLYNGGSYRDTDWYDCVGSGGAATMTAAAEFPLQILFIYGTDCANLQYDFAGADWCEEATLSRTVADGTHFWPWVGPSVFSGIPCNSDYRMHLNGLQAGPALGACCVCLTCTITAEPDCQGQYQGDWTTCVPNLCDGGTPGVCCSPDGACLIVPECACGGIFQGPGSCDPNPCGTPVHSTSWGAIKSQYWRR